MTEGPTRPFAWKHCPTCGDALILAHDGESERPHCAGCNRFFYRNPVPAACCFVSRGDGDLLIAQRAVEPCKGEWSLPGGYVELGESSEEAARRELEEETGLRAHGMRLLGVRTQGSPTHGAVLLVGYVVEEWDGALRAESETMALDFFGKHERPPLCFDLHRQLISLYDESRR